MKKQRIIELAVKVIVAALTAFLTAISTTSCLGSRGDRTRTCDSLVPNQERYQLRYTSDCLCFLDYEFAFYLMIPCSTKIFFRAFTERSTCSSVCVAIRA